MSGTVLLSFEKSVPGRRSCVLPELDVPRADVPEAFARRTPLALPELCEVDVCRHYTQLAGVRMASTTVFIRWAAAP